jgi:uncharacterized protein (TIGR02466 family)
MFGWQAPAIDTLKARIAELLNPLLRNLFADAPEATIAYRIDGWGNVLRDGQYSSAHNHPGRFWSGVYYVSTGAPDAGRRMCGELEFIDPRAGANMSSPPGNVLDRGLRVRPQDGMMVLFPSWLKHFVHPYFGPGERISVGFNITCTDFRRTQSQAAD